MNSPNPTQINVPPPQRKKKLLPLKPCIPSRVHLLLSKAWSRVPTTDPWAHHTEHVQPDEPHRCSHVHSCVSPSLHFPIQHFILLANVGRHQIPVSMAGHLQHLQAAEQPVLCRVHADHHQAVQPDGSPEPQAGEAQSDEAAPVQQRGRFDHSHSQLRLAGRHACDAFPVEGPRLARVKVPQPDLLLRPALPTPRFQVGGRAGKCGHGVAPHMEVDLTWEMAQDEVTFGLWDVLGVRNCDVMDGIQIVTWRGKNTFITTANLSSEVSDQQEPLWGNHTSSSLIQTVQALPHLPAPTVGLDRNNTSMSAHRKGHENSVMRSVFHNSCLESLCQC